MTISTLFGLDRCLVWDTKLAFQHLKMMGQADTKRTTERRLHELSILPAELKAEDLKDEFGYKPIQLVLNWELEKARRQRKLILFLQQYELPNGKACLHANDARGGRYWVPMNDIVSPQSITTALESLQRHFGKTIVIFPHGGVVSFIRELAKITEVDLSLLSYQSKLEGLSSGQKRCLSPAHHLKSLEAESIYIMREAVATAENPVMLYSIGKDSSVMLHLARKAFYPSPPPFPLLHVDTRWKFQQMYHFRDYIAQTSGMDLLVYINPEAIAKNINPFDHGSELHTTITKTEGLKQALDNYKFDIIFGGARRDEEKSRAKERIFSFRSQTHHWDPKNQRPELWHLYNTQKNKGESIRVFPLSNWTELDIWQYIHQESIPVVPLYFAKERPIVMRDEMILLVDDDRFRLLPGEKIQVKKIRFRTLGCYPLTGAIVSSARNVPEIIVELINSHRSEREGRAIDSDTPLGMEKKKQEGYF